MQRYIFITWLIFFSIYIHAQENIIPNGNFDEEINCGVGPATIAHWFIPNATEIDVSKLCPYIDWWRFIRDKKQGYNGSQCGYVETYYKGFADDNIYSGRIYIAVKLHRPLIAGRQYYFEMKVKSVDTFPNYKLVNSIFTNAQDVAFTKEQPIFDYDIPRNYYQIKPTIVSTIQADYEWHTVSSCFVAEGHERYMIIGNFRNDANTDIVSTGKRNPNFPNGLIANYAIDDVVLVETHLGINDTAICKGQQLVIENKKTVPQELSWSWSDGSKNRTITIQSTGSYSLELRYGNACTVMEDFRVSVLEKGYKPSTILKEICPGDELVLNATIGAKNEVFKWRHGENTKAIKVNNVGTYVASITNDCIDYKQEYIVKEGVCEDGIFIPNILVRNKSEPLRPYIKNTLPNIVSYRMQIFDRWGNFVFESNNPTNGWDGTSKGKSLPVGVYIYSVSFSFDASGQVKKINYTGDITLVN